MENLIYAFVDEENSPFYIGKTKNLKSRKTNHLYRAKSGCRLYLYCKLRKMIANGEEFDIVIIESEIKDTDIDAREQFWIAEYKRLGYKLCNLTDGGEGGKGMTPEMQKAAAEKRRGQKRSLESRKRMSESRKGIRFSEEHKKHLSEARKERIIKDETRLKCSRTSKGKINTKTYNLIDPQGNVYTTEHGLTSFCEQHGLTPANLLKVLKGERSHHKGWRIERVEG
jgi:group I intron endonuclease